MTDKLKQIVEREVAKLPKEVQDAIGSLDWGKITEEIGEKNLLDDSETNDLQAIILTVLLGLEDLGSVSRLIENEIGTSKDEAEQIAKETGQRIFDPIFRTFEEKMKENPKAKNPNWEQSIDFILSGGNYGAFLEENNIQNNG